MNLRQHQLQLLSKAATVITSTDVAPYFRLRSLLHSPAEDSRAEFRRTFSSFYGLNNGGLTGEFKDRYFDLLFRLDLSHCNEPPYEQLLLDLYRVKRRIGDQVIAASFVSKLIAMHDERRPLYDRHVRGFFGRQVPAVGPLEFRIAGFISMLDSIQREYHALAQAETFGAVLATLRDRIPELLECNEVRICDFLVWTVGRRRIDDVAHRGE